MEKIDFIKWWSEANITVRYNALLSVTALGLISIIIYQHNERKSDAEINRANLRERDNTINDNNKRFDSTIYSLRLENKECQEQRFKEIRELSETYKNLSTQKKMNYENDY
jgi:hypothetical protein